MKEARAIASKSEQNTQEISEAGKKYLSATLACYLALQWLFWGSEFFLGFDSVKRKPAGVHFVLVTITLKTLFMMGSNFLTA